MYSERAKHLLLQSTYFGKGSSVDWLSSGHYGKLRESRGTPHLWGAGEGCRTLSTVCSQEKPVFRQELLIHSNEQLTQQHDTVKFLNGKA